MFSTEGGLRAVQLAPLQPRVTLAMRYAAALLWAAAMGGCYGRLLWAVLFPQSTITPTTLTSGLNPSQTLVLSGSLAMEPVEWFTR
jgi:hypothetical protein